VALDTVGAMPINFPERDFQGVWARRYRVSLKLTFTVPHAFKITGVALVVRFVRVQDHVRHLNPRGVRLTAAVDGYPSTILSAVMVRFAFGRF
jgi:hypothetical protein